MDKKLKDAIQKAKNALFAISPKELHINCFINQIIDGKQVEKRISPVGCNLVDIRCRTEFPRILYNNREKDFVQRFFSEIVDIYTVFPDLYEEGTIQTVNLVMKDNVLKSIVVLAYGEVSETKDGKEVIHKAEYTS